MSNIWYKIERFFILLLGKIKWPANQNRLLNEEQLQQINSMLTTDYYIILTHRSNELSTFFTGLATFLLSGRWGYWSHALMNAEDEVKSPEDFRLVEAVGVGVKYTPFDKVFDLQGACLLKPKRMPIEVWTAIIDAAVSELGKPYDTLFDISNDKALSCVELVRTALMRGDPNYESNFSNFEALIKKNKNLAPETFYRCGDFEPVLEIRR